MEKTKFLWTFRNAKVFFSFAVYCLLVAYIVCMCCFIVYVFQ